METLHLQKGAWFEVESYAREGNCFVTGPAAYSISIVQQGQVRRRFKPKKKQESPQSSQQQLLDDTGPLMIPQCHVVMLGKQQGFSPNRLFWNMTL
jgi:hypothetical protein